MVTRLLLIVLAVLSVAAQETEPRHDKYKDDAHAYCWNPATAGSQVERRKRDPHAHLCSCHLMCRRDGNGEIIGDQEDGTCELYCTRSHCTCHQGESPCEGHH